MYDYAGKNKLTKKNSVQQVVALCTIEIIIFQ